MRGLRPCSRVPSSVEALVLGLELGGAWVRGYDGAIMASDPKHADSAGVFERLGRRFEAGEVLYREGDPANVAYLVDDGRVRLVKRLGGTERGLRVVRRGDLFGEEALLPEARRDVDALSLTAVKLVAFDGDSLRTLLSEHPSLGAELVKRLVLRAKQAEDRIQISMLRDSQTKVVMGLMRAAHGVAGAQSGPLTLELSPLELSARVGLDVEAVKRTVQRLTEADYVRVSEEALEIPNLEALQELYGLLEAGEEIVGGDPR